MPRFRRRLSALLTAVFALFALATAVAAPASAGVPVKITLIGGANDQCLDVPRGTTDNKQQVEIYYCKLNDDDNQKWTFLPGRVAGWGQLRNVASGKCLDVRDTSTADGAAVQQYTCIDVPNQQWTWDAVSLNLKAYHSNLCLGAPRPEYKKKVWQYSCSAPAGFIWWNVSPGLYP
ncbi:RICIN domain-containing protein [Actinosynnema sp. NPDC020468]|uniref:RICIN domain-containing protein n=1 Tax=Actinosynnema sp. NPDC020468 TaxID=3154488 RepID=UPI003406A233